MENQLLCFIHYKFPRSTAMH